jgi:2-polyprenyl-3-methyl-5-hydroxy-6-metoxy-1,4-benzoquinol methylase
MKSRLLRPELMDDPELDRSDHFQALRGLQRINHRTQHASLAWGPIQSLAHKLDRKHLSLLDIGTGGADVPIQLWQRARSVGLELKIDACDLSPQALEFAAENCLRTGAPVQLHEMNILNDPIDEEYDLVICSQFLHHLPDEQAELVLGKMATAARLRVIVVDLIRSRFNWLQVWLATRILSRSRIVHFDGPQSIRAAFTLDEVRVVAERIGFSRFSIESRWPCRFTLVGDLFDV